jgi:hypothetical protein
MAIVGFEFTKINVNKKDSAKGKINISNNVRIVDLQKSDLKFGATKQGGVKFVFEYKSSYEPEFAEILLGGVVMYLTDEKDAAKIVDDWKKETKLNKDVAEKIINNILTKCNIQSIILSDTVNLPPPVPMPKVNVAAGSPPKKEEKKEKQASLKK